MPKSHYDTFSLLYTNIRSLNNKLFLLDEICKLYLPDTFILTETWLTPITPDSLLPFSFFHIFRKDRDTKGGGCLIAIRKTYNCTEVSIPNADSEIIAVDLHTPKVKTRLISCYCPPNYNSSLRKSFFSDLNKYFDDQIRIIILGDLIVALTDGDIYKNSNITGLCHSGASLQ